MAIVSCPECGKKLKIADTSVGKKVKGPCGHVFVADSGSSAPVAAAPPAPAVAPEKVYVACSECGAKLKVATTSLGKKMKCPKCSAVFVANMPDETPVKKAPPPPVDDLLDEDDVPPPPPAKGKSSKPAVTDDDMDDLMSFAQADADGGAEDKAEDEDLFKNEPVKSRAKRKMDEEAEADEDAPKPKGKAKPADEDEDEAPRPKGKKPPPMADAKPVYPSRLLVSLFVFLLLLIFGGLVGAIFFEINIAREVGLPESKGIKPKLPPNVLQNILEMKDKTDGKDKGPTGKDATNKIDKDGKAKQKVDGEEKPAKDKDDIPAKDKDDIKAKDDGEKVSATNARLLEIACGTSVRRVDAMAVEASPRRREIVSCSVDIESM